MECPSGGWFIVGAIPVEQFGTGYSRSTRYLGMLSREVLGRPGTACAPGSYPGQEVTRLAPEDRSGEDVFALG